MARVFIVNEPLKYNPEIGRTERSIDLGPAEEFGELVHLLPPGMLTDETIPFTISTLHAALAGFTDDDYLLPVGDPVAIGLAAAFAAAANEGRVKYLRWRRRQARYVVVATAMWLEEIVQ